MQIVFRNGTGCEISRHDLINPLRLPRFDGTYDDDLENVDLIANARMNQNLARDLETLRPGDSLAIIE